jgi:nucleoside-diphosphate-sugar epimerase
MEHAMRIAVTGGNGNFGRRLVPYLLEQGHAVVSIDRSVPPKPAALPAEALTYGAADVGDFGQLVQMLRGCDALIHLAAYPSPLSVAETVVYAENTVGSYHALAAAAMLGIQRVCLASSINAIGGVFSRAPRYDYFPLDEAHPSYAEEPYSLSKWVLEQQADAFARRYHGMRLASMRFHWLLDSYEDALDKKAGLGPAATRHLWGYTAIPAASRACLLALSADFAGHEAFYIVAPRTAAPEPSLELARRHYPETQLRGDLGGQRGFFDCSKAARLLGWRHEEA